MAVFKASAMSKRKQHDEDPDAWLKDYPAYFDPAYRNDIAENKEGRLSARQKALILKWDYELLPEEAAQIRRTLEHEIPDRRGAAFFSFVVVLLVSVVLAPRFDAIICINIIMFMVI
ncbi:MAG: hypothetical protein KC547_22110 [Anaerolineae bacterium]|nr:hypothetical protein [Anaerolineae bacterium]